MLALDLVGSSISRFARILFLIALGLLISLDQVDAQSRRSKETSLKFSRSRTALPKAILKQKKVKAKNMKLVKPPRSSVFYDRNDNTLQAQYERLLDQEIANYYKLSQSYRRSKSRGEIWLRLAERYVEKARILEFREQEKFEKAQLAYEKGKVKRRPRLNLKEAKNYHLRAIRLYEWFVRDFPRDPKIDQALFFLGYNYFEVGQSRKGEKYYQLLTTKYPRSAYVSESHFALGEYYFENDKWRPALVQFNKVIKRKRARLYSFALYKAAWCLYRMGRVETAIKTLEKVIRVGRKSATEQAVAGTRAVNKIRLVSEALKDYVPFYAEAKASSELYKRAERDFTKVARKPSLVTKMLEGLAYIYADSGNRPGARYLFQRLIDKNPMGEKSADYKYQIVQIYSNSNNEDQYKNQLYDWINEFGPKSEWAKKNSGNEQLVQDTYNLQESTLRNKTLQLHQTAQNSRAKFSQKLASRSYEIYLNFFEKSKYYPQMRFFYAELLFDQGQYAKASDQYQWYFSNNDKKSEFYQASVINNVLALEKQLPTAAQIDEKRKQLGKKTEKFEMDANSKAFIEAAKKYSREFPDGDKVPEVLRRVGVLYYAYNHFDEALVIFGELVKRYPKSKDTMIAAELTLDIYKLKDDIPGFQKTAQDLLAVPSIANSKVGADIQANLSQAALMIADNLSKGRKYKASAENFEKFVKENPKNPSSIDAIYNSALNYQKAGDTPNAIRMYSRFAQVRTSNKKTLALQKEARSNLADLFRNSGLLAKAARQYEVVAKNESNKVKKKLALNNAALIYNSLNDFGNAKRVYGEYKNYISKNEAKDIEYQFAEMEYRRNNLNSAMRYYERYVANSPPDAFKLMKSVYRVADISQRMGKVSKAAKWYEKTRGTFEYFKNRGNPVGVKFAAEARFILALSKLSEMRKVKIGNTDKSIQAAFLKLDQLANQLDERMKGVIAYNYGPFIVAALTSSAQAREIIALRWAKAPVPKGYNAPEQKAQFKQLYTSKAKEMQNVASDLFKKAYERSLELEAYGPWTGVAQRGAARYNSQQKFKLEESVYEADTMSWGGLK